MKKIIIIALILILVLLPVITVMAGCAKLVSTEYETVQVEIVDQYHRGSYMTPCRVGKVTTFITHPAVYRITVAYNGVEYSISGHDTWEQYRYMVGMTVPATIETRVYDDGTVKYDIVALGEENPNVPD